MSYFPEDDACRAGVNAPPVRRLDLDAEVTSAQRRLAEALSRSVARHMRGYYGKRQPTGCLGVRVCDHVGIVDIEYAHDGSRERVPTTRTVLAELTCVPALAKTFIGTEPVNLELYGLPGKWLYGGATMGDWDGELPLKAHQVDFAQVSLS